MGYDGWLEFNDQEFANLSRTAQLAQTLGIDTLWITPESVQWIQEALGGVDYDDITNAPWYDPGYEASAEFAGLVPLSLSGLDDSTLESSPVEYITDGGNSGKPRRSTLPLVASVALIASTDRGAEYGKRWMEQVLSNTGSRRFCSGADLTYFRYSLENTGLESGVVAHRRNVSNTRGVSITRKRRTDCSATWISTFTWTAADPAEYGEPQPQFTELGGDVTGPTVVGEGALALVQESCPQFDYTPIYDPLHPALVAPPTVPDFYPAGWNIDEGMTFDRLWAQIEPVEPSLLRVVPVVTLTSTVEARMVRVSIWPSGAAADEQCEPLWSVVVTYLPPGVDFVIDGEQQASYVWDGVNPRVRRADSLVYSPQAEPVDWVSFNDPGTMRVTLDIFADSGGIEGDGEVRAALDFVPKSN